MKDKVKSTIEDFINCKDSKRQFGENILQSHHLGKVKYELMQENEAEKAAEIYRFILEERDCPESKFEECVCDLFSYLEPNYFGNENDFRSCTVDLFNNSNLK